MYEIIIDVHYDVCCTICGESLCSVGSEDNKSKAINFEVCPNCMAKKEEETYDLNQKIDNFNIDSK